MSSEPVVNPTAPDAVKEGILRKARRILCATEEGRVLLAGMVLTVALLIFLGILRASDSGLAHALFAVLIAHILGGRAVGVGTCITHGVSVTGTVLYNLYIEALIVAWMYGLFVLTIENVIALRFLRRFIARFEARADRHRKTAEAYGWIGLFLFVMVPIPFTGPVMGSMIGYLLKFRLWRNLSSVMLGTLVAIVLWTLFFDFLEHHVHMVSVAVLTLVIAIVTICGSVRDWFK